MGVLESIGLKSDFFGGFNFGAIGTWATIIFLVFLILIIAGVITFFYYSRKLQKAQFKNQIPIFQSINGKQSRIGIDKAKEVFVPDSNVSLFYLKDKKIYIARPTRAMGKDEFWYSISENGEWVNFDMSIDPEKNTLSLANYDHRDTRYAYINLKEIIKRNYKDKSIKWWKEFAPLITFVIVSFIFIGSCWILLAKIGNLIQELAPFVEQMRIISENMVQGVQQAQNINSGVVQR